jgi:hypothetical protein
VNRDKVTSALEAASGLAITAGALIVNVAAGLIVFGLLGLALSWRLSR